MSSRKLVSVQEITNIEPIEGADRIEVARILGWRVVVGKDMHLKPGDRVAYFETDSLLPAYDPRYKAFQARGQKTMIVGSMEITGHVLRTMKLRGVYSQGLIMRLDELGFRYTPAVGTDITDKANVLKYEEPLPMGGAQIGRFDAPCSTCTHATGSLTPCPRTCSSPKDSSWTRCYGPAWPSSSSYVAPVSNQTV